MTIDVPTFLILPGILFNRAESRDLKADMHRRFKDVERRFNELTQQFNQRLDRVEQRLDGIDNRLDRIDGDLKMFDRIGARLEGRVDELSRR